MRLTEQEGETGTAGSGIEACVSIERRLVEDPTRYLANTVLMRDRQISGTQLSELSANDEPAGSIEPFVKNILLELSSLSAAPE
jgi:hypothetical protein